MLNWKVQTNLFYHLGSSNKVIFEFQKNGLFYIYTDTVYLIFNFENNNFSDCCASFLK